MSGEISPNKIDDKQERQAEHLKAKFQKQGMGQDEAANKALEEVAQQPNTGGRASGGESHKGGNNPGGRTGSQSNESK